ncbi:SDR family NAD(P)-dependent oxidoreductase [Nocardioides sp. LS1]|uniref:SDR family NAD(P)-dependent oxidoreductase n=1 Tax=Nocardioides sp. LS1 TaxID=1027620 RepID=UPI000F618F54|nr:SDR family NAD(P)-dependent oxidoreductase [Nocardioides sp. LS1]GCD88637.1 3-(cis-5,6-dihydroxycyclohexa-1, 3-dien-1-yl)propanoate dehydrogenase [Nocardioides sp. LS1]
MSAGWLQGDVALVTGGGTGIGRAVAERFVAEGASVTIVGRKREVLEGVIADQADPQAWLAVEADVRDTDAMHDAVGQTVGRFGRLDILVPNAGVWDFHRHLTRLSGHELAGAFDELFAINVKGYVLAVEAAWRELVKARGSIVMTLSNASFYVNGGGPIYTAAKHACLGLMREMAYELAPHVRVNAVAPGGMNTDLRGPEAIGLAGRSIATSFAKRNDTEGMPIPLHHSSTDPVDFTGPYVLLASREQSGTITGETISADGGIGVRGFASPAGGDHLLALVGHRGTEADS